MKSARAMNCVTRLAQNWPVATFSTDCRTKPGRMPPAQAWWLVSPSLRRRVAAVTAAAVHCNRPMPWLPCDSDRHTWQSDSVLCSIDYADKPNVKLSISMPDWAMQWANFGETSEEIKQVFVKPHYRWAKWQMLLHTASALTYRLRDGLITI